MYSLNKIMGVFNHMNSNPNINTIISNNKPFFITAYYKKSKDPARLFMNEVSTYQIIPYDCRLNEISCYFYDLKNLDFSITLNIRSSGKKSINVLLNSTENARRQNFPLDIQFSKNDILWIEIYKQGSNTPISQDEAVFSIVFSI